MSPFPVWGHLQMRPEGQIPSPFVSLYEKFSLSPLAMKPGLLAGLAPHSASERELGKEGEKRERQRRKGR